MEGKLGEAEERAAAVAGGGARAEEEGAKAQELRKSLDESAADRAEVWYYVWCRKTYLLFLQLFCVV